MHVPGFWAHDAMTKIAMVPHTITFAANCKWLSANFRSGDSVLWGTYEANHIM